MTDARFGEIMIGIPATIAAFGVPFSAWFSYRAQKLGYSNAAKIDNVAASVDGHQTRQDAQLKEVTELVSTAITGRRRVIKDKIKKK